MPKPQFHFQFGIRLAADGEFVDVDRIGNDRDLAGRNAARDEIAAQAFADDGDGIGLLHRPGFQRTGEPVAQAAFFRAAVVDRRVFPEGANFIDHGDAQLAADTDRRHRVQHRRMRVDHVGLQISCQGQQTSLDGTHHGERIAAGQARQQPGRFRRAIEMQAVGLLFHHLAIDLLGTGQVVGVPAHFPLVVQDRRAAEGIAGMQRQGVVEDVEDAHDYWTVGFWQTSQNPSQDKSSSDNFIKGAARSGRTARTSSGEASTVGFMAITSRPLCATASR